jgi:hypothetical protein
MISSARIAIDKTRKVEITLSKSVTVINISSSDIDLRPNGFFKWLKV